MQDDDPKWIEMCLIDPAWANAKSAMIAGTCTIVDVDLMNCLKYGSPNDLSTMCKTNLLAAYGQ